MLDQEQRRAMSQWTPEQWAKYYALGGTVDRESGGSGGVGGRGTTAQIEKEQEQGVNNITNAYDELMAKIQQFYNGVETGTTAASEGMQDFTSSIKSAIDAIRQQTAAFANFTGLFDIFERKHISGNRLMNRLKAQVKAMGEWQNSLVTLQAKGISEQFLQTLRMMGPGAVDEINALAGLDPSQLAQYEGLYNQKMGIGATQAGWANQAQNYIENQINLEITGNTISNESDVERVANQIIAKLRYAGVRI
jgi:hypothetical protein